MSMSPSDFIGRCLDAANRALRDTLPGPLSTTSFQVAGLTLHALPGPLVFELNGYDFTVEMTDMHEMMQITAVMVVSDNHQYIWEATMVLSKLNNSIIEHWLSSEEPDEEQYLVLFRLMTDNRFIKHATI
jgi:hypothetical protein